MRASAQNWQTSYSLTLLSSAVKTCILWTPIPSPAFGNQHRVTQVEWMYFVIGVSIYKPCDYIGHSGQKQILSVKCGKLSYWPHANSILSVGLRNLTKAWWYTIRERKYFHGIIDISQQAAGKIWHLKNLGKWWVKFPVKKYKQNW